MYKYFIAYNYVCKKRYGFGNCEYIINRKIEDFEIVNDIIEKIKKQTKFEEVAILNYKLLKEVKNEKNI